MGTDVEILASSQSSDKLQITAWRRILGQEEKKEEQFQGFPTLILNFQQLASEKHQKSQLKIILHIKSKKIPKRQGKTQHMISICLLIQINSFNNREYYQNHIYLFKLSFIVPHYQKKKQRDQNSLNSLKLLFCILIFCSCFQLALLTPILLSKYKIFYCHQMNKYNETAQPNIGTINASDLKSSDVLERVNAGANIKKNVVIKEENNLFSFFKSQKGTKEATSPKGITTGQNYKFQKSQFSIQARSNHNADIKSGGVKYQPEKLNSYGTKLKQNHNQNIANVGKETYEIKIKQPDEIKQNGIKVQAEEGQTENERLKRQQRVNAFYNKQSMLNSLRCSNADGQNVNEEQKIVCGNPEKNERQFLQTSIHSLNLAYQGVCRQKNLMVSITNAREMEKKQKKMTLKDYLKLNNLMKKAPQSQQFSTVSVPAMRKTQTAPSINESKTLTRCKSQKSKLEVMEALKGEIRKDLKLMKDNIELLLGLFVEQGSENIEYEPQTDEIMHIYAVSKIIKDKLIEGNDQIVRTMKREAQNM